MMMIFNQSSSLEFQNLTKKSAPKFTVKYTQFSLQLRICHKVGVGKGEKTKGGCKKMCTYRFFALATILLNACFTATLLFSKKISRF